MTGCFRDDSLGQPVYRCLYCSYDTFDERSMGSHITIHPQVIHPEDGLPLSDWIKNEVENPRISGTSILIGLLTWNTVAASSEAARAIMEERRRLECLGLHVGIHWCDNGSTDGTVEALSGIFSGVWISASLFSENVGQCPARNYMIREAVAEDGGYDYLMLVDGDIEIIPYSAFALALYLSSVPHKVGCAGLASHNCTAVQGDGVANRLLKVHPEMVRRDPRIAWTQYGMFRTSMLREGLLFEERGPFSGPGWGFEDDDFYLQMQQRGYESVNTPFFRYYHRPRGSSVRNLGESLAAKVLEERRSFLLEKWKGVPEAQWRIQQIAAQHLPQQVKQVEQWRATVV